MKEIRLSQGKVALVDDIDFEIVSNYGKWSYCLPTGCITGYARSNKGGSNVMLHNFIMQPPEGMRVDHKDRNGLNCTRENLRLCTNTQNSANRGKQKRDKLQSKYKGPFQSNIKHKRNWYSQINRRGEHYYLGTFKTEEEAARSYDEKAKELFGEFACLNFPETAIN